MRGGASLRDAFGTTGVVWATAKLWMKRGRDPKTPADDVYVELVHAMEQAQASYRSALSLVVTAAAKKGSWQAAIAAQRRMDERDLLREKLRRDRLAQRQEEGSEDDDDRVVLLYPVPSSQGAVPLLPESNTDSEGDDGEDS